MQEEQKYPLIELLSLAALFFILIIFLSTAIQPQKIKKVEGYFPISQITVVPTIFEPFPYKIPKIPDSRSYRLMLVGDSMIDYLGPNAESLRQQLLRLYPEHEFVNYNYGFGATSIESLPDRLTKETTYKEQKYPAILSQGFELIIIESFAYNPLSQENSGEGLAKHLKILDESIKLIIKTKPEAVVAIMTPIAPNKKYFAKGVYELSPEMRGKWVEERVSYIKAVIDYANKNKIPLINVYEKTVGANGDGELQYINLNDFIHPSERGINLMSKTIAEYIYNNNIFPR